MDLNGDGVISASEQLYTMIFAVVAFIAGVVGYFSRTTWLRSAFLWLWPRLTRSKASQRLEEAQASKTEAEAAQTWQEVTDELRKMNAELWRQVDHQNRSHNERMAKVEVRQTRLERRQSAYEMHIDDVYQSIHAEGEEAETRIRGRWKTQRPPKEEE